jgi:ribosomal protein S12 methylthiotransferase
MKTSRKLNLISLGCAKNLVDSEIILGGLKDGPFEITEEPEEADTIVINTCGFLDLAREESVETILKAAELKQKGNLEQLVVMGCLSERYPEELAREIPEVDRFFGSNDHRQIISFLTGHDFNRHDPLYFRSQLTPRHYAYLKIAEGCDNGCSFCSIPLMRGLQKSRTMESILWEAEKLVEGGVQELLVIAQDTTTYGWDLKDKIHLGHLIERLDQLDLRWIRVHYAHPAHLSTPIIQAFAQADKVCHYLDIPVQHASDPILKSMRRGLNRKGILERIGRLREAIPDIRLRTTVIVGYPGETEADFKQLYDFIETIRFDRLGIFTYSEEEGTLAAELNDDVPREVKDERMGILQDLQANISLEKNESLVGKILPVLVDDTQKDQSIGRTEYDSPEIDNVVIIDEPLPVGKIVPVKIVQAREFELMGTPVLSEKT